jgi:hypothetical protein
VNRRKLPPALRFFDVQHEVEILLFRTRFSSVKELHFLATGCKKYHLDNNLREGSNVIVSAVWDGTGLGRSPLLSSFLGTLFGRQS